MLGGYFEVVADRAPFVFLSRTFFFIAFFFWRCSGMMLLGMAVLKLGLLAFSSYLFHSVVTS